MNLHVQRLPAIGQTRHQVDLPQRFASVKRPGVNPTDLLSELSIRTWCRKGDFAHMVFDVERVIVNPVRLVETERNRAQLLAQQRYQRGAFVH
jgi:hypothetical protein